MEAVQIRPYDKSGRAFRPSREASDAGAILIVDDDPAILAGLRRTLRASGYKVRTAHGPRQALEALDAHSIDVVIADEMMPGLQGHALLELVFRLYPETALILLSGAIHPHAVNERVRRSRASAFLRKPCPPSQLVAAIESATAGTRTERFEICSTQETAANDSGENR